jgi:hypothetical protein
LISAVMTSLPCGIDQPSHLNQPGFHPTPNQRLWCGDSRRTS